jgi:tRNA A-37 threonylcarbamoyl transferase component Bud32
MVPLVHYYGDISVYRSLVTTYIDGLRFNDFTKMNPLIKEACRKSVAKLHSYKVLHGDLEPWNFIIKIKRPNCNPFSNILNMFN